MEDQTFCTKGKVLLGFIMILKGTSSTIEMRHILAIFMNSY